MEYVESFKTKYGYDIYDFHCEVIELSNYHERRYLDENNNLIAKVIISADNTYITNLFVSEEYRGYGMSYELLDVAMDEYGANMLTVNIDNKIAIHAYERYGFRIISTDGIMHTMKFKGYSVR